MLRQGLEPLVQGLEPLVQCALRLCQCALHLCQCALRLCHCAVHLRHWTLHLRHWALHLAPWPKRLAPGPEGLALWLLGTVQGPEDLLPWKEADVPWPEHKLRCSLRSSPRQFPELQRPEDLVPGSETARAGRLRPVPAQLPKHLADLPGCLGLSQGAGGERRDDDDACLEPRRPRMLPERKHPRCSLPSPDAGQLSAALSSLCPRRPPSSRTGHLTCQAPPSPRAVAYQETRSRRTVAYQETPSGPSTDFTGIFRRYTNCQGRARR